MTLYVQQLTCLFKPAPFHNLAKMLSISYMRSTEGIYSITIGIIIVSLILYHLARNVFYILSSKFQRFFLVHVIYGRGLQPISRLQVAIATLYVAGNAICNLVGIHSISDASKRAARLSLINLMPMFMGGGHEYGARLLGTSLNNYSTIHQMFGYVAFAQGLVHTIIVARTQIISWSNGPHFYGLLVSWVC